MTAAPTSPGTVRVVGRYALYQAIASGGMATVYLGRLLGPVGFARTVAIKRLHPQFAADPEFVAMFLDEARLAARIRHPNVMPTVDVVATKGELFLVMEYVQGESVSKLVRLALQQESPIPVPIVVSILSGALQGLDAAHNATSERGAPLRIVHRDVSPQNILVGTDGQPRLLDFGVARAMGRSHTTQQGTIKGKIAYMAPEQLRGEELGPVTDIYAAAIVMWEALVGRRLYGGDNHAELVLAVLAAKARPPSQALREAGEDRRANEVARLDGAVMKALSVAKGDRWQTAREFSRALEGIVTPASASQVSDWVEHVAGTTLRDRATMVAEIENSSAISVSAGELGRAIAGSEDSSLRTDSGARQVAALIANRGTQPPPPPVDSSHTIADLRNTIQDSHPPPALRPGGASRNGLGMTQGMAASPPIPKLAPPTPQPLQRPPSATPFQSLMGPAPTGQAPMGYTQPFASQMGPPPAPQPQMGSSPQFARAPLPPTLQSPSVVPSSGPKAFAFAPLVAPGAQASDAHGTDRHRNKLLLTAGVSALVVVLLAGGAVFSLSQGETSAATGPVAASASGSASLPPPTTPSSAPPLPTATPSAPPPPASPAPSASVPPPAAPPPEQPPAAVSTAHAPKHGSRAPAKQATNCDPPFTFDSQGTKYYKEECL